MKTKRLVQRALAFLCFTIASCSKNKPCVGSKIREKSPKQVSIKVLTANIPTPPASSTNLSTTTSSQVPIAEVTKPSDNLSSRSSTSNTSSSALYSSATKAELDTITKYLPAGHGVSPNNPVALLDYVLLNNICPGIDSPRRGVLTEEEKIFYDKCLLLVFELKDRILTLNEGRTMLDNLYHYKRKSRRSYDVLPEEYMYYLHKAKLLQLAIILSRAKTTHVMCNKRRRLGGRIPMRRNKTQTVEATLQKYPITQETIGDWKGLGVTLDEETINYWEAIAKGNNEIKKLINLEGLKTLKKNAN